MDSGLILLTITIMLTIVQGDSMEYFFQKFRVNNVVKIFKVHFIVLYYYQISSRLGIVVKVSQL